MQLGVSFVMLNVSTRAHLQDPIALDQQLDHPAAPQSSSAREPMASPRSKTTTIEVGSSDDEPVSAMPEVETPLDEFGLPKMCSNAGHDIMVIDDDCEQHTPKLSQDKLLSQAMGSEPVPSNVNGQRDMAEENGAPNGRMTKGRRCKYSNKALGKLTLNKAKDRTYVQSQLPNEKKKLVYEIRNNKTSDHYDFAVQLLNVVVRDNLTKDEAIAKRDEWYAA